MQVVLCKIADIPEGGMKHFELMGYDILAVHVGERFYGLDAACTFQWANLADGLVDRERMAVVCKDCKGTWDLETGQPKGPPAKFPLTVYDLSPIGDELVLTFTY